MADNTLHSSDRANWLERRFALRSRGGTLRTECLAGITGFLAAAYLLVVIPGLLAIGGMDKGAATTGTILVFVVGSLLMAFYANLPFIVGPGIGGSVLVGVTLAGSEGIGWQTGLGIACWSGILFFLLTRFGLREVVTRSVPQSIKLGQVDLLGALNIAFLPFLFVFFASEFFSTMGTTLAVGGEAGLLDEEGNMPQINRPFMVDSIAAALGPWVGIPAATALIESSAAAEAGGKTGLTALSAAVMFLLMLLFTPVALMIPKEATAPALILIGLNMFSGLRKVDLGNFTDGLPVLMMVMITLIANSFGTGIAGGLLFYIVIKAIAGKWREIPIGLWVLAVPLVYYFATLVRH